MSSLNLAKGVIDPNLIIKLAEENAKKKTGSESSLTAEKKAEQKKDEDKKKPLNKRASLAVEATELLLKEEGVVIEKKAEKPKDEKSAVAASISTEMKGEAISEKAAEESLPKEKESVIKLSEDFYSVDSTGLNEEVATAEKYAFLGKAKKPLIAGLGLVTAGGLGLAVGEAGGKSKLRNYIAADQKRDVAVSQQAFRIGQMDVLDKLKKAISLRKGATNG